VHVLCLFFFFPSWLASLVELDRSKGQLGPSPFCRLVCKTRQPEPSPFATSQMLAGTEPSPSWLVSSHHGIRKISSRCSCSLERVRNISPVVRSITWGLGERSAKQARSSEQARLGLNVKHPSVLFILLTMLPSMSISRRDVLFR
jgi:hypothetical protein